jgi:RNA polymerase sigma-70 factor (ECF subfamily)
MFPFARAADAAPVCSGPEAPARECPSFEALYPRYLGTVFSYVLYRVRNNEDAEDITAETFEAALVSLPRFRGDCRPDAWLLAIARQQMARAARRDRRAHRHERREVDLSEDDRQILGLLLTVDVRQLPEDRLLREEAGQVMRQLLARLPEAQREALLLQVQYSFSIREVAQILGRTVAGTNSLLQRARARIFRDGQAYFRGP